MYLMIKKSLTFMFCSFLIVKAKIYIHFNVNCRGNISTDDYKGIFNFQTKISNDQILWQESSEFKLLSLNSNPRTD